MNLPEPEKIEVGMNKSTNSIILKIGVKGANFKNAKTGDTIENCVFSFTPEQARQIAQGFLRGYDKLNQ